MDEKSTIHEIMSTKTDSVGSAAFPRLEEPTRAGWWWWNPVGWNAADFDGMALEVRAVQNELEFWNPRAREWVPVAMIWKGLWSGPFESESAANEAHSADLTPVLGT
jgi:hypothetical protein